MTDQPARETAARFIADWNTAAIARSGGLVICPTGRLADLPEETRRQIAAALRAGRPVQFVTGSTDRDHWLARHLTAEFADGEAADARPTGTDVRRAAEGVSG